jgi:hypothetical protein
MEYSKIAELENRIALLKEDITNHVNTKKDDVERRKLLAKIQIEIGKYTRQLRTLKGLS